MPKAGDKSPPDAPDKNMGRRFEILTLVDGTHSPPAAFGAWSAKALGATLRISHFTVHHILQKMRRYALVESGSTGQENAYMKTSMAGKTISGSLPSRTLNWWVTQKGKDRIQYVGGHETWCPICKEAK